MQLLTVRCGGMEDCLLHAAALAVARVQDAALSLRAAVSPHTRNHVYYILPLP